LKFHQKEHWTIDGTAYMSKERYNQAMKGFCKNLKLEFKDIYDKRYKDEDETDRI